MRRGNSDFLHCSSIHCLVCFFHSEDGIRHLTVTGVQTCALPIPTVSGTRISVVQQAATNLINSLSNVNIGLMRYSNNLSSPAGPADPGNAYDAYAAGGMVAYPVSPVAVGANRPNLVNTVNR